MGNSLLITLGVTGTDKVASELQKISAGASALKGVVLGLGAALAAKAGLGSLADAALNTAKLGGELSDLSARTGISTKSLIVLRQAFADCGVGAENVGKSVSLLQKNIFEAATAGGAASSALSDMGLKASDLAQLAPEDMFNQVAKSISAIENPTQRTAAAMAIFGKSGAELLPLFADGGALTQAQQSLGKLPDVLSRNVPVLDAISDAFDRLPNKATQLFAGIADQLGPSIQSIMDWVDKIDLTGIGQKIGAAVNVGIDMWKQGRFAEFITLSIGAAFELGVQKGKEWLDWLFSTQVANAIGNFTTTLVAEVGKAFIDMNSFFKGVWNGMMIYAGAAFVDMVKAALNFLADGLEKTINGAIALLKVASPMLGNAVGGPVSLPRAGAASSVDFGTALEAGMKLADMEATDLKKTIDGIVGSYREFFGMTKPGSGPESSLDRLSKLSALINEKLASREVQAAQQAQQTTTKRTVDLFNFKLELQKQELQYARDMQALTLEKGKVEASWLMSSTDKYRAKKAILDAELATTVKQIQALGELRARTNNPDEQAAIDQKTMQLNGQAGGLVNQIGGMGPDPNSYTDQFAAAFQSLQEQAAITAQSVAQTFTDVFNSAINSISSGITGLIMGTKTWGQALQEIGTSILTSIVSAIVQMGVRWIATQILMAVVGKSIMAAATAASAPIAAAQAAIWATPATLATISSYGAAASAAPGFIAASQGIVMAQSMAAFRTGGYTGDGHPDDVAGIVHRGEYVVPAEAVDRIGVSTLEAMAGGSAPSVAATSPAAPSPITLNMGVFDDKARMADWAKSSEGRTVLVDVMRQHAHEFSR